MVMLGFYSYDYISTMIIVYHSGIKSADDFEEDVLDGVSFVRKSSNQYFEQLVVLLILYEPIFEDVTQKIELEDRRTLKTLFYNWINEILLLIFTSVNILEGALILYYFGVLFSAFAFAFIFFRPRFLPFLQWWWSVVLNDFGLTILRLGFKWRFWIVRDRSVAIDSFVLLIIALLYDRTTRSRDIFMKLYCFFHLLYYSRLLIIKTVDKRMLISQNWIINVGFLDGHWFRLL